jgi:hypothetical protein
MAASGHSGRKQHLPHHPFAASSHAFVLTEVGFLVRTPAPIAFTNDDTRFVRKIIRFMRMPAGVARAYDGGG